MKKIITLRNKLNNDVNEITARLCELLNTPDGVALGVWAYQTALQIIDGVYDDSSIADLQAEVDELCEADEEAREQA